MLFKEAMLGVVGRVVAFTVNCKKKKGGRYNTTRGARKGR
jgi:hypothetical protein